MKQYQLYINGEFLDNGDREMLDVVNPATEEVISQVPKATEEDVAAAVDAAYEAQKAWGKVPAIERAEWLNKLADKVDENRELFAQTNTAEMGKRINESRDEATWLGVYLRYYASLARTIKGEIITSDSPNENIFLYKKPIGVCAGIMPWNFPLFLIGRKVAPALVCGDTVVLKPSSDSPNGCFEFAKLCDEIGLPKGVVNVVSGSGAVVGNGLSGNPKVAMVSMTGSTPVGKQIMKNCAENVTKVSLELGGNAPFIVMDDCDLDATIENCFNSRYYNCGEVCNAAERVYVQAGIYDEFVAKMTERVAAAKAGDPLDESVDMGPMVNAKQREIVLDLIQSARDEGAKIVVGGNAIEGKGYFIEPTLIVDCDHDMRIMREEIFGPVMAVSKFETLDEAIEKANDTNYGLTSSIHTTDFDTAMRGLNEINFGEIYVNRHHFEAFQGFHAGVRQSGLGGDDGEHGLEEFLETHIAYVDYKLG
ncbi:Lactaldehyde dehydrogenase [Slackia heliotrinireducens]|uniref:Lactaldehyde dehydrogenase n=1 Tax=Slackia heliotrinireducens (strain ATCC 29202 / DSM 20476 / NCTC 11029 / RHS 1) TaxID=471855 RepID=C7N3M4_SLAHD|nr:aldehyde dehydrogenase [Slackia heliotrinireducens]ACV21615.1 lactaldehyde dehydrogenase [Slackia heliotrinireducens DSM 20476]VEG99172.1 Lactaldehyde dehydrogenase [Slackia heliotrinireducens]